MRPLEYMSIFADMKHLSAFMLALVALAASARPDGRDTVSGIHVLPHDSVAYAPPMSLVYKAAYTPAPMSGTLFGERPSLTALDLMPDGGVSITPGEAVIHSWPSGGNRWEAQPIVMPYFRFNGKDEIGLDIGGIMYNLLRSNIGGGWGAVRNPTIPPPIP